MAMHVVKEIKIYTAYAMKQQCNKNGPRVAFMWIDLESLYKSIVES